MPVPEENTEKLTDLLRSELAACETYERALQLVDEPELPELQEIETDHRNAVYVLEQCVVERGGQPVSGIGVWADIANAPAGAPAIRVLLEGEAYETHAYEAAVSDEKLDPKSKERIASLLLPRQRGHSVTLEHLLNAK